ncbi:MAG: coiled-coil domain-containing protein [Myxococcaceae bacterium]
MTVADARGASPDAGGARSVSAARKTIETARGNLAKAVQRIEKDPPSTADLDAAHAAVGALKDAIDAGAQYESEDLDFAKAVLAARKELRTQREYVDERRAKVHIHNHRRAIDQAVTDLGDRARSVEGKQPSAKDFDDARAAAAALKKAVDEARQFTKQDEKFATYVAKVDATVARHEKAIDDRWTLLSADKHRALVTESREALSAAMAALAKGATDAQFEAANLAASLLSKRLEEGKPLEAKEKGYRADADRARAELAQAKARMDKLLSETGLARLKSEIEPAHKDLVAAGRAVRARNPTADQLAEARTAAIVVRKLVEKFQPQASLSQAFGQYVNDVKKTLIEVEIELQRRGLDSARKDLVQALRNIEKKAPTDEHFEEAKTAQVVLEKTLETVHAKEPALAALVGDARALVNTARTTTAKRRVEVDVQRQRAKVEEARKNAAALMAEIQQPDIGKDRLQEAGNAVKQLGAVLDEGAALTKQDREYAAYEREVKQRIVELNERIAKRTLVLAASTGRTLLTETITGAKARLEAAKQPSATDPDIDSASRSVEAVGKAIEAQASLEEQDKGYAAHAERARVDLERLNEALDFAKQARALRRQTVEALSAGASAALSAAADRDLRSQKGRYEKAVAQFRSCESAGESLVKENRALANIVVLVEGDPSTPKDVTALCAEKAKATEQLLKQVVALIGFEEGPKRGYEAGKGLLANDKKSEALTQFYDCISSGKILLHRNPELKDRQFQVAGASMTLHEVIQLCLKHRDSLGPK